MAGTKSQPVSRRRVAGLFSQFDASGHPRSCSKTNSTCQPPKSHSRRATNSTLLNKTWSFARRTLWPIRGGKPHPLSAPPPQPKKMHSMRHWPISHLNLGACLLTMRSRSSRRRMTNLNLLHREQRKSKSSTLTAQPDSLPKHHPSNAAASPHHHQSQNQKNQRKQRNSNLFKFTKTQTKLQAPCRTTKSQARRTATCAAKQLKTKNKSWNQAIEAENAMTTSFVGTKRGPTQRP